ncbi:hypothetical protein N7495_009408 [Penicillium taxi]|uniref:uncharacterized protein n=1 Tax=Penicillium taxi TaxID=168475 RepID=UPI0025459464|nr:uncharacterized protein N7495_009408 [Penicillium taxi]KAJ5884898.1 hypothetical protein N7495_009408 [Penicillium taxi]
MHFSRRIFSALAILTVGVHANFGPYFSTGPVTSESFVLESTSTLILPRTPTDSNEDVSIWVGMSTSHGDLIRASAVNTLSRDHWKVSACTVLSANETQQTHVFGRSKNASPRDEMTVHYKYNESTGNYTQTVLLNGRRVSGLTTRNGKAKSWASAVECNGSNCGTLRSHAWYNTTIVLDTAEPGYIDTINGSPGVSVDMTTGDGGKTWKIGMIVIPEYTF